jgi:hypothetical protein
MYIKNGRKWFMDKLLDEIVMNRTSEALEEELEKAG